MLKILGAILLICGATAIGFSAAGRLKRRVNSLNTILCALELIEREISFRLTPIPDLLTLLSERICRPISVLFSQCLNVMDSLGEYTFGQLWRASVHETPMDLVEDDLRILEELGDLLGRYDGDGQQEALGEIRIQLLHNLQVAEEESRRMGRVYGVLGLAVGSFTVILLL